MGDDPISSSQAPDLIGAGFRELRADLREDVRELRAELSRVEDRQTERLADVEKRVTAHVGNLEVRVAESRELLVEFAKGHGEQHEEEAVDRRREHGQFYEFIRKAEVDEARKAGALGVVRFTVELFSKHSGRIVQIVLAVAGLLGLATGAIKIGVGE